MRWILPFLLCLPAAAQADKKAQIRALAQTIVDRAAQESDPKVLKRVRAYLKKASAELVRSRSARFTPDVCIDFARDIYARTMLQQAATKRAMTLCRQPVFMPAVRYLYATYAQTRLAKPALERAVDHARARTLRGRMPFLKFVVDIFDDTRTQQAALRDGLIFVDALPRAAEACVRASYAIALKTMVSLAALERARATCLGNNRQSP